MKKQSYYKNRKKSLFEILLTIFVVIPFFFGCNEITEPNKENIEYSKLDKVQTESFETIKAIAKGLSVFLQEKNNRQIFRTLLNNSKYPENIIESSEFLNDNNFKDIIAQLLPTKDKLSFLEKVEKIEFGQFDIYFPNQKWRDNWKFTDELYIAAVGYRIEDNKDDILAFDIKGNEIYLSSQEEPSIPTLVVYPSEKSGNYSKNVKIGGTLSKIKPITIQSDFKATSIRYFVENDHDPAWYLGDMEIYFYVSSRAATSSVWSGWTKIYMDQDTEANTWVEFEKTLVDRSTNFVYTFKVMEEDSWPDPDDLVAGNTWAALWDGSFTYQILSDISTHSTITTYGSVGWQDLVSDKIAKVRVDYSYPPPLSVSISGPSVLYGSPSSQPIKKRKENIINEAVQSATGTWSADAIGGEGNYSHAWYYRSSPTSGWTNTGITSQSYTRTIYNYIEFKCEVTSGTETVYATKTVSFILGET